MYNPASASSPAYTSDGTGMAIFLTKPEPHGISALLIASCCADRYFKCNTELIMPIVKSYG